MAEHYKLKCFRNILYFTLGLPFLTPAQSQFNLLEKAKQFQVIDSSIIYAQKNLESCFSSRDTNCVIETSCFLARAYNSKSQYSKTEKVIEKALSLANFKKDEIGKALLYIELANKNKYESQYPEALKLYLKAYDILEQKKDWTNLLTCTIEIAEYYRKITRYEDAKNSISKAFDLYKKKNINSIPHLIRINNRAAAIGNETGDSSIYYSQIALQLSKLIDDKNAQATSLNELGFSFKNKHVVARADSCYKKAEELWFSIGADREAVNAMNNRAMLYSHHSYPESEVIKLYFKIIDIVEAKKVDYSLTSIFYELHVKYLFSKDLPNAYKYFRKYHDSMLNDLGKKSTSEVANIKEKYENDKIKLEVASVSNQLSQSNMVLEQKKRENLIVYSFLIFSLLLVAVIIYLLSRVQKNNKILQGKNKEKDVLIQEIHHRVKNNLQFVSSLINMQINSSQNAAEVDSLNDASRRIRSMALVHEMLYNQEETSGIEIKKYLNELVSSINDLVNSKRIPVKFNIVCEELIFETSKAIALGMITSELISNSIKYAFGSTDQPEINISLKTNTSERNMLFNVEDNGAGLNRSSPINNDKLGMRLIDIFSRQLKGNYSFESNNGLLYKLSFINN